jgi:hypothetical protein
MKNKHNKKRNTAFLYEVIVREITNSILEKIKNNVPGIHVCGDVNSICVTLSELKNVRLLSN